MGAVLILTPVVVAAWPALASAVASAATSLGYATLDSVLSAENTRQADSVQIEVPNSEVVTGTLGRDQKIVVQRNGVTITFRRDERGKASLSVSGDGYSHEDLRAIGEEMSQRVVREYVYQQIKAEISARDYVLVDESVDQSNAIRLTVRHWEN